MKRANVKGGVFSARRIATLMLAAAMACSLSFPQLAFAVVRFEQTDLVQGDNAVGGGTATLVDSNLSMTGVKGGDLYTDENLSVNFNGGNSIENVNVAGTAEVDMSFAGQNRVEEVHATDQSNVTINANGHNDFEEIEAAGQSNLTINVTGDNKFEEIVGRDDANVTVRGTDCQKKDAINLGEGEEDTKLVTENGKLTIDHATVNIKAEEAIVGSTNGEVRIDTSKIAKNDASKYVYITAGGKMLVRESVVDIMGTVHSKGEMTIEHSDMKVGKPDSKYDDKSPYRIYSETGIKLIREKNGDVEEGEIDGEKVWYVDTDDNEGEEVDLEADGKPAYYTCKADMLKMAMPKTGDDVSALWAMAAALASLLMIAFATKRREGSWVASMAQTRFKDNGQPYAQTDGYATRQLEGQQGKRPIKTRLRR